MAVEIKCKNFTLITLDNGKVLINSGLQQFRLQGRNGSIRHVNTIATQVTPTSTLTELVGLFYTRDEQGNAKEQIVEMVAVRRDYGTKD